VGGREGKEGREEGIERGEETPFVYKQYSRRTMLAVHATSIHFSFYSLLLLCLFLWYFLSR
jgi:hypothetical protein